MVIDDVPQLPVIAALHHRHRGLTEAVARYYAEGVVICMQRHHVSPKHVNVSANTGARREYLVAWEAPSERQMAAWANRDDATRDGAYGIVIAAVEAHLGLFAISRAAPGSGSDYLLSSRPYNQDMDDLLDYEDLALFRLEISGIDRCMTETYLESRVREKVEQLRRGESVLPGIAGVVAFDLARVTLQGT